MKKYLLITILLVTFLFASCKKNYSLGGYSRYNYTNSDKYQILNQNKKLRLEKGDIMNIDIDYLTGDINFIKTNEDTISLEEQIREEMQENDLLHYFLDEKTLKLKYAKSNKRYKIPTIKKVLNIYIPENIELKELKITTISGDLNVNDIKLTNLKVETVSGNSSFKNLSSSSFDLNSVSGNIEISNTIVETIEIETISGTCNLNKSTINKEAKFNSVSGSIILKEMNNVNYNIVFDTVSGVFYSKLKYDYIDEYYVFGTGSINVKVETVSGDFSLKQG